MIAFAQDRICSACSTRYTPPTPAWARLVFGIVGFAALGFGGFGLYDALVRGNHPGTATGILPFAVAVIVACGCFYKALSR
jgi:hypothetical protein